MQINRIYTTDEAVDALGCRREYDALRRERERTVSLTAYVGMLAATNIGWVIGTLLYHWAG